MQAANDGWKVLVTGAAGYIGSHVLRELRSAGHVAMGLDNLYAGHRWAVLDAELATVDLGDRDAVSALLAERRFDAVVHCAAHIWVGESMRDPGKYYRNNMANAAQFFDLAAKHGVRHVVFSSTAAVYGEPDVDLIGEDMPKAPINPYGAAKMMAERALTDIARAHGMTWAVLRYFNVAGADAEARIGEATPDNSHLIKLACQTAFGLRPHMAIFGTDYDTPDGTCIRDYVHVDDIARAHHAALGYLAGGGPSVAMNCGYGHGFSVREVLDTVRRISGVAFPIMAEPRRAGDPPRLVADNARIRSVLGWEPRHDDLDYIVRTAWQWERKLQAMATT